MMNVIYQIMGLLPILVIAAIVFGFYRAANAKHQPQVPVSVISKREVVEDIPAKQDLPKPTWRDVRDLKVVAVDLRDGKATVVVHERPRYHKSQALLIVWTGKKKARGKKLLNPPVKGTRGVKRNLRVEEAVYDLGFIDKPEIDSAVVEEFLDRGRKMLADLVKSGEITQRKVPVAEAHAAAIVPPAVPVAVLGPPVKPEAPVVLQKVGSVFRGEVLEIGLIPGRNNQPYYGMRIRQLDGTEEVVHGKYLRTAFKDAGAGVGDFVEVIKTGRKSSSTAGNTPMTMFQVAKLSQEQLAQVQ